MESQDRKGQIRLGKTPAPDTQEGCVAPRATKDRPQRGIPLAPWLPPTPKSLPQRQIPLAAWFRMTYHIAQTQPHTGNSYRGQGCKGQIRLGKTPALALAQLSKKGGFDKTARICLTAISYRMPAPHRELTQGTGLTQICTDLPDGDFLQDASPPPLTGNSYRERSTGSRSILHGHRPSPPRGKSLALHIPRQR